MRNVSRVLGGSMLAVLCTGTPGGAESAPRCTNDGLTFDGTTVTATLCLASTSGGRAAVNETFARGATSVTKTLEMPILPGAEVSRAVDDVSLERFGSPKRMHVTVALRDGAVVLEHAILLPGAVVLK